MTVSLGGIIKQISLIFRKNNITYNQTKYIFQEARKHALLKPTVKEKVQLPELPSDSEIEVLLRQAEENPTHWLMIKLLLTTGVRISELLAIKASNINFNNCSIFIRDGKTGDRVVLFPESLRMYIKQELNKNKNPHLFVSRLYKPYSRGGAWKLIKKYAKQAGIEKRIHPHLFRHYFCTKMSSIMGEGEVMVLSGHVSKSGLQLYQHLDVESVKGKYDNLFK